MLIKEKHKFCASYYLNQQVDLVAIITTAS